MKPYGWLGLLAIALAVGWWLGSRPQHPAAQRLAPDPGCDLAGGICHHTLPGGGRLTLSIDPAPPKVMVPLTLTVALDGRAQAIWVDFVGLNMDMGFNRAELAPAAGGLWSGQVVLPVCTAAEMHWEAKVFVATDDGLMEVPFRFSTRP